MIHFPGSGSSNNNASNDFGGDGKRPLSRGRILRYDPPSAYVRESEDARHADSLGDADMEVTGAGFVGGPGSVRPVQPAATNGVAPAAPSALQAPRDEILISDAARSLSEMQMDPQVRAARLAEIKAAIDAGTYDTPQRLEAAIEKMITSWQRGA
jgi:anti-sigma28 factor (negative regulator of flagellin synthesis)